MPFQDVTHWNFSLDSSFKKDLHHHKMVHKTFCDLWERPLRNKAVQWMNPQELTLVLFSTGRRAREESYSWYKQKWENQVWTQEPPMPEFFLLPLIDTPLVKQSLIHVLYLSLVWEDIYYWDYISFFQPDFLNDSKPLFWEKGGHRLNYCFLSLY